MSWTALAGRAATIPVLVVGVLLTGCGVTRQPDPSPTPTPVSQPCNCVVRIPVRPLDPVPPIVVHPLTQLAAKHTTAAPLRPSPPPPPPPHKRHHRRHPGH
jgi:hypothetical protein